MGQLFIGVMSGTSLDGIDVSLCEINSHTCTLLHAYEYPFDTQLKEKILHVISSATTLQEIGTLNSQLGILFADSINAFLQKFSLDSKSITAIGLHGQTLWHEPDSKYPFSMQLGCANVVSAQTNIQTVSDFRSMDIANGGQGAPFAPAFHQFVFSHLGEDTAVLNIGGMANITRLGKGLQGWDVGVGNALMDYWASQCRGFAYDKDGLFAKSGKVIESLLRSLLNDTYFKKLPPKSTGREYFNASWLANHLPTLQTYKDEDIQRTLLELTAQSITNDITNTNINMLVVCGGGAKNSFLMERLQELNTCKIQTSDTLDVSSDFMESMAFAWLAYKRVNKETVDLKSVTGSKKNSILGAIYG